MEFITLSSAVRKWQLSELVVQHYCATQRIPGATQRDGTWVIPADAQKPSAPEQAAPTSAPITPMPLLNTIFTPGNCQAAVEQIQDPHTKAIAQAEYAYFSGQAQTAAQIAELYLYHPDLNLRLSACLIYAYANLTLERPLSTRMALEEVRNIFLATDETTPPALRASAASVSAAAAILLHLPLPADIGDPQQYLPLLPPGLRVFSLYAQAHHAYLQGDYGRSIGIAETALSLQAGSYLIPTIYLHLVSVMDYMSLKQPEKAQAHLLTAWDLARPDDLIEGFGEHHGLLGGMLEAVLKKDWPEDFRRIIHITYRFSSGWRKVHNPTTGHDVADNLTTTEFATAMLAARGWSNQEIANHMGVSPNTIKRYISTSLQKLNVKQRKDLRQFMLR